MLESRCHDNEILKMGLFFILRQMQALNRMEHALTAATEQFEHMRNIYEKLKAKVICEMLLSHEDMVKQLKCPV